MENERAQDLLELIEKVRAARSELAEKEAYIKAQEQEQRN